MAVMMLNGLQISINLFVGFIAMLGITIVAAPGVPGGAVMASLGVLELILGFTEPCNDDCTVYSTGQLWSSMQCIRRPGGCYDS